MMGLGVFLACRLPGSWPQRLAMGLPTWIGGGISLWFPLRQRTMYVQSDADGLECRGYFRTVRLRWEDVVGLIVRELSSADALRICPRGHGLLRVLPASSAVLPGQAT